MSTPLLRSSRAAQCRFDPRLVARQEALPGGERRLAWLVCSPRVMTPLTALDSFAALAHSCERSRAIDVRLADTQHIAAPVAWFACRIELEAALMSAPKDRHRLVVHPPVARGDNAAPRCRRPAVPGGD